MLRLAAFLVALSGCSLATDAAEVIVTVRLSPEAHGLASEIQIDGQVVSSVERGAAALAARGSATVECTVSHGTASATGSLRLDLENGWRYPVTCAVQADDPAALCFGCRGSQAFALDPALGVPGQSLWVAWAGDPIDSPPTY